jgi:hypothetical protein
MGSLARRQLSGLVACAVLDGKVMDSVGNSSGMFMGIIPRGRGRSLALFSAVESRGKLRLSLGSVGETSVVSIGSS